MVSDNGRVERPTIIELARRAAGLTQGQLAERAGTSQSSISEYERRRKSPTLDVAERLVQAAGADLGMVTLVSFELRLAPDGLEFFVPNRLWRVEVPDCLATLRFPDMTRGTDQHAWNLADRLDRVHAYEILLTHGSDRQIFQSVDAAFLCDAWDELRLPRYVREAWTPVVRAALPE